MSRDRGRLRSSVIEQAVLEIGIGTQQFGSPIWPRIVRWLEGDDIRSGSVSVLGVGAGISRSHVPPRAPVEPLHEFLSYALAEMTEELGRSVLVHVNNLENLTAQRTGELALLMRDLRDYLLLPVRTGDFESLRSLVASRSEQEHEFRVTDATKVLDIAQPTATRLVERLLAARVIRQTRTEGW